MPSRRTSRKVDPRYEIRSALGEGGTGSVYRALDRVSGREVALKVLRSDGPGPRAALAASEFRFLASHNHPHLVKVFDYGIGDDGRAFFSMELCRGENLVSYVRRRLPPLPGLAEDERLLEILRQILTALDYIHSRKFVHRDLKPSNVLVSEEDAGIVVKLIDFGLARTIDTGTNDLSGTLEYIAPERLQGQSGDVRSDLYSMGVLLYEILTGRPPFQGSTAGDVVRGHLHGEAPAVPSLPGPLSSVTRRLLERDPRDRPRSADEVLSLIFGEDRRRDRLLPAFGTVFVGREELMSRLLQYSREAQSGRGRSALLLGNTGVGKSRLLRELQVRLQVRGIPTQLEVCGPEARRPGGLLKRVLEHLAPQSADSGMSTKLAHLLGQLEGSESAPVPSELHGIREDISHRFATLLLEHASRTPSALLVDDLQSIDTLSLEAVRLMCRLIEHSERAPILLVVSCRDDVPAARSTLNELKAISEELDSFGLFPLGDFSEEDIARYLTELLGTPGAFADDFPATLLKASGGNPYFIEEYLSMLAEIGRVYRIEDGWRIDSREDLPIPSSVEDMASDRLSRLDGFSRSLIDWAAVLSGPFGAEDLTEIAEASEDFTESGTRLRLKIENALAECVLNQVFRRDGARYTFSHAALKTVAYDRIDTEQRTRRHRLVAIWYQMHARGDGGESVEQLAHHWYLSDQPARSKPYLLKAASRARFTGSLREASDQLSKALTLAGSSAERLSVLFQREDVWSQLGERDLQKEDLEKLAALTARRADPSDLLEVAIREALYLDARGDKRQALEKLEQARQLGIPDRPAEARLLSRIGMIELFLSDFERSSASLRQALGIARSEADRSQEAECLQLIGLGNYLQGQYDQALIDMGAALALRRALGDDYRAGSIESNLGLIQFDRGSLDAAEERFQSSLKAFRGLGHRRGEAVNLLNLGLVSTEMGRLERALDFITRALEIRRELGDRHGEGADLGNLGAVWMRIGRFEKARPYLEESLTIARQTENRQSECVNECRIGWIEMQRGRFDRAERRFLNAEKSAFEIGGNFHKLLAATSIARLRIKVEQPAEALKAIEKVQPLAEMTGMRSWLIDCLALRAMACLNLRRLEDAEQASTEAVAELDSVPGWLDRSQEVWFIRYQVLLEKSRQSIPAEAPESALRRAYSHLREKADAFQDHELRTAFLQNIEVHREIDRLHREMQQRIRREAALRERSFYEIAKSIHSIMELDPLLDRLLQAAIESTHADKGLILLRDSGDRLITRAARGMARESVEDATNICRSVISDVAQGGDPVLATDASSDDRFRERQSVISFQIRTLMCVPLKVRENIIGAVYVDGRGSSTFSPEDLEYLVCFAQLAAIAVENARLLGRLKEENFDLRREVGTRFGVDNVVARSAVMKQLMHLVQKVARSSASVLISGETGTGKSIVARAIHYASDRQAGPFVTVDCGALPESLLESELFGHRQGAFSGALYDRVGLIEEAEGGTLFLDEITNTSVDLQAKLLRVIQEGEIRRIGENRVRKVKVRILAATNADVGEAVSKGVFREDLYYRLNVVAIEVPPLRHRREDIPLLVDQFLAENCERLGKRPIGITEDGMRLLYLAEWKGNVRELENVIEKALILTDESRLTADFLGTLLSTSSATTIHGAPRPSGESVGIEHPSYASPIPFENLTLEELDRRWHDAERQYLLHLLERSNWNFSAAARLARVRNRNTLVSRLKKHGIRRPG